MKMCHVYITAENGASHDTALLEQMGFKGLAQGPNKWQRDSAGV